LISAVVSSTGLERAHADRVLVEAGHEQPTARAEQPRELGTERVVVAGQVGLGERDAGVLRELVGDPFAVLAEQGVDDRGHLGGGGGGNGQRSTDRVGCDVHSASAILQS
jgi:hypothetical protein